MHQMLIPNTYIYCFFYTGEATVQQGGYSDAEGDGEVHSDGEVPHQERPYDSDEEGVVQSDGEDRQDGEIHSDGGEGAGIAGEIYSDIEGDDDDVGMEAEQEGEDVGEAQYEEGGEHQEEHVDGDEHGEFQEHDGEIAEEGERQGRTTKYASFLSDQLCRFHIIHSIAVATAGHESEQASK